MLFSLSAAPRLWYRLHVENDTQKTRERVLGYLRSLKTKTATLALLSTMCGLTGENLLTLMMDDMLTTPEGRENPSIYCNPNNGDPALTLRY